MGLNASLDPSPDDMSVCAQSTKNQKGVSNVVQRRHSPKSLDSTINILDYSRDLHCSQVPSWNGISGGTLRQVASNCSRLGHVHFVAPVGVLFRASSHDAAGPREPAGQ